MICYMKLTNLLKAATDMLLPRVCAVCERKLYLNEAHLCIYCWSEIPMTHFWERDHNAMADRFNSLIEERLGTTSQDKGNPFSEKPSRERYAYATALFFYDGSGAYRKIPHLLKYHGNLRIGRHFGRLLGQKMKLAGHFADVDVVIPVPLHWTRKWKRGYNQAEIIAAEVATELGIEMRTDILRRCRRTKTQTKVNPEEKSKNVRGAFEASCRTLNCRSLHHVILLDDVFTSGATLHNCFLALRSALPVPVRISIVTLGYVGSA